MSLLAPIYNTVQALTQSVSTLKQRLSDALVKRIADHLDTPVSTRLASDDARLDNIQTTLDRLPATVTPAAIAGAERLTAARAARLDLRTHTRKTEIIQSSRQWIVPAGVYSIDVVLVGGGGSGSGNKDHPYYGAGGASGVIVTLPPLAVTAGHSCQIIVGAGGVARTDYLYNIGVKGGNTRFSYAQYHVVALGGHSANNGVGGLTSTKQSTSTFIAPTIHQQSMGLSNFDFGELTGCGGDGLLGVGGGHNRIHNASSNGGHGTGLGSGGGGSGGSGAGVHLGGNGSDGGVIISYWQEV